MKLGHFLVLILVVLAAVIGTESAPAFYTAINAGGVTRLVNKVLPPLFEQVKNLQFPECHDGHHHITDIRVPEIGIGAFNVAAESDLIKLSVNQFHAEIGLHYRYKRKLFRVSANVRVRIGDGNFHFHLGLHNNDGRFGLNIAHVSINAGEASVRISGGLAAKFINAVKSLFKSRIKHTIIDAIRNGVNAGLSSFATTFVGQIPLTFNISNWGILDFSLAAPIVYHDNRIIVGFNGEMVGPDHSPSGADRHNIPFHATGKLFDIAFDTFVFNSGFQTFFKANLFNHVCTAANPNGFDIPLNTDQWGQRGLPQLQTKYPNSEMNLQIRFNQAPVITSNGGHAGFQAVVGVTAQVHFGGQAINVFRIDINQTAAATAAIVDRTIIPQITGLNTQLSLHDSIIGDFSMTIEVIQHLVNFANNIAAGVINNQLLQGIPLPVTDRFVLTDVSLVFPENAFAFGCDIDFHHDQ